MILPEYVIEMAAYNEWQNETLYGLVAELSDAERKRDRGMFFGSIHNTLDHILYVDSLLLAWARDGAFPQLEPHVRYTDFGTLQTERGAFDEALRTLAASLTPAWLRHELVFFSERLQTQRRLPRGFLLTQMFNHATHHRSQVTSQLHMLGVDYGSTDLPYNPKSIF